MTDLAERWLPPVAYPAVIDGPMDDGRTVVHLPDFQAAVTVADPSDALTAAGVSVRRHLRHRMSNNQLFPFASDPRTLGSNVLMVSTAGWDRMEEVEDE